MAAEPLEDDPAPPDAGEPQGADDDRPAMLGKRFRLTLVAGMVSDSRSRWSRTRC